MSLFTRSEIIGYGLTLNRTGRVAARELLESESPATTIFLSHSHKDRVLIDGLLAVIASEGIELYVDWKDGEMPRKTCAETGIRIREKIFEHEKFLLVATDNALESLWVPWELGVADGLKSRNDIAVWAIANDDGSFAGREYLDMYPRFVKGTNGGIGMIEAGQQWGVNLHDWLYGAVV